MKKTSIVIFLIFAMFLIQKNVFAVSSDKRSANNKIFFASPLNADTSYSDNSVDSANYVVTVFEKPYNIGWWQLQHRKCEDGRNFNVSHFGITDLDGNCVLDDIIEKVELFDPDGNSVQLSDATGLLGDKYISLYGRYNSDMGQWQYDNTFSDNESYYHVEFDESLITGTYHLRLTDISENIYDSYRYYDASVLNLPVIPSNSAYAYKDESGNVRCSWMVPENIASDLSTSVRADVIAMTDGVNLGKGDIYITIPTHMGQLFIPNSIFQMLESVGNSFKIILHLRTNDNFNRAYSNPIVLNTANLVPIEGDFNRDGKIDLKEALNALRVISGQ